MSLSLRSAEGRRRLAVAGAAVLLLTLVPATTAEARPSHRACTLRNNNTFNKLLDCIRVEGVRAHQEAFQAIADANDGNRAAGLGGYDDSVDYVVGTLEAAGWSVALDEFDYQFLPTPILQQHTPVTASYETGAFTGSATGSVPNGTVIPVDVNLTPPFNPVTSGCEASDFTGLDFSGSADIALIQRGTCTFAVKALNAQAAGAEAVVIFNQGNTPERSTLIIGTLAPDVAAIPVVGASFADGQALAQAGSTATVTVDPSESRPQVNVIAELPGSNADNVVMAGAHLDSVRQGPGINDNGSGSAALLEIAVMLGHYRPQNTLRFAWWGAEEDGLLGSTAYVEELAATPGGLDDIALYLNFDMISSPNYIFMIYDSDESGFPAPVPVPAGSIAIEDLFESYFTMEGEPYDDAEFSGRSDYQAFIEHDIPAGGLFTGAEVPKTPEQVAIWGGTAGAQFDPCYHLACDTIANVSDHALDVNSDAIAFVVLTYANTTESVNGVPGRNIPGKGTLPPPAGPEGTVGDGGGLGVGLAN